MIEKLKKRWGIARTLDIVLIMSVFSLAGATESLAVKPLFRSFFQMAPQMPQWLKFCTYLLAVPLYQGFLLLYGLFLGQFRFFWEREKQIARWFVKLARKLKARMQTTFQR